MSGLEVRGVVGGPGEEGLPLYEGLHQHISAHVRRQRLGEDHIRIRGKVGAEGEQVVRLDAEVELSGGRQAHLSVAGGGGGGLKVPACISSIAANSSIMP